MLIKVVRPQDLVSDNRGRMINYFADRAAMHGADADKAYAGRLKGTMGRSQQDRALAAADIIRRESFRRGDSADNTRNLFQSMGVPDGRPPLNEESLSRVAAKDLIERMGGMNSGQLQQMGETIARAEGPGIMTGESLAQAKAQIAGALADTGTRGDIARVGAVSTGVAGLTASGAALIDLMQFLTQGQEVDQERSQVLPS